MSVHMYHPENNATLVLCEAVQNSSDMSSHIKEITPADVLKESNTPRSLRGRRRARGVERGSGGGGTGGAGNAGTCSSKSGRTQPSVRYQARNTQSKKDNMSTYNIHNSSYRSFPPNIIYGTLNAKNPRATSRSAEDTAWWQEHLDNA